MHQTASDLMRPDPVTIPPEATLAELERELVEHRVGGLPVMQKGRLIGFVTRTDIVRKLCLEQALAEATAAPDQEVTGAQGAVESELGAIGAQLGHRLANIRVEDVMHRKVWSVDSHEPIENVAKKMLTLRIHHLPVFEGERLAGIISTFDLARFVAEQTSALTPELVAT